MEKPNKTLNFLHYTSLLIKELESHSMATPMPSEDFFDLLLYRSTLQNQISYNRKNVYISLIHTYLNEEISFYEFIKEFRHLENRDSENTDLILNQWRQVIDLELIKIYDCKITLDPKAEQFNSLLSQIIVPIYEFDEYSWRLKGEKEKNKDKIKFQNLVGEIYIKLKKL